MASHAPSDTVRAQFNDDLYKNLKLSFVRYHLTPDFGPSEGNYNINAVLDNDTRTALAAARARNSNMKTMFSVWTPPAYWKRNNRRFGAHNNADRDNYLLPEKYDAFATYCAEFTKQFKNTMGYQVDLLSPQNEPDVNVPYDSCVYINNNNPTPWPLQFNQMLEKVTSQVRSYGNSNGYNTKIVAPEWGSADSGHYTSWLDNAGSNADYGAVHTYGDRTVSDISLSHQTRLPLMQTEFSFMGYAQRDTNDYNTAVSYGQQLARDWNIAYFEDIAKWHYGPKVAARLADKFAGDFNGQSIAWFWWWLGGGEGSQEGEKLVLLKYPSHGGYTWDSYRLTKKYHAMKALSNTFLPGAIGRATSSDTTDVSVAGAKNSDGRYAVMVSNKGDSNRSSVVVKIDELASSGNRSFRRIVVGPNTDYSTTTVTFRNGQYTDNVPANTVITYLQSTAGGSTVTNYLTNADFEYDRAWVNQEIRDWMEWNHVDRSYTEEYGGSQSGTHHLTHYNSSAFYVYTYQQKNIPNGRYSLRAWVKGSGQLNYTSLVAKYYGGADSYRDVKSLINSSTYTQVSIDNINVTSGRIEVGFLTESSSGAWVYFDNAQLVKTG
jgi:hypothetical protein